MSPILFCNIAWMKSYRGIQGDPPKGGGNTVTMIDGQVGYVVDSYSTRFALGFTHASDGGSQKSNALFAGVQLQK